jgi:hypothetical protein
MFSAQDTAHSREIKEAWGGTDASGRSYADPKTFDVETVLTPAEHPVAKLLGRKKRTCNLILHPLYTDTGSNPRTSSIKVPSTPASTAKGKAMAVSKKDLDLRSYTSIILMLQVQNCNN